MLMIYRQIQVEKHSAHPYKMLLLFFKFSANTCPFLGPLFWISVDVSSELQTQSGFCLIHFFAEGNVMYITQDPPLVLHVPTSWQLALLPVLSPHTVASRGELARILTLALRISVSQTLYQLS